MRMIDFQLFCDDSPALSTSSSVCAALVKARMYDLVENVVGENVVVVVTVIASGG